MKAKSLTPLLVTRVAPFWASLLFVVAIVGAATLTSPGTLYAQDDFNIKRDNFHDNPAELIVEQLIVDQQEWAGHVAGSYSASALLSNRDTVYLKLKNPAISVGDRFAVFSDLGPVSVPGEFDRQMGRHIRLKGFCEVIKVESNAVVARIYDASWNIQIGDPIAPLSEVQVKLAPQQPKKMIRGKVIKGANDGALIGPFDTAFINRGARDGLAVNDRLFVYRTTEISETITPDLPQVNTAELVVVHVSDRVATVYVHSAEDSFRQGAPFKSAISDVIFMEDRQLDESSEASKANDAAMEEFEGPRSSSYFSLAFGVTEPVDRDGIHSPGLAANIEFGGKYWALPFQYTLRSGNDRSGGTTFGVYTHNIKIAPQFHLSHQLIASWQRVRFYGGIGPVGSIQIFSPKRSTAPYDSASLYRIGVEVRAEIRYYMDERFFFNFIPVSGDLYFWQYLKVDSASTSKVDTTGDMSSYIGVGMTF